MGASNAVSCRRLPLLAGRVRCMWQQNAVQIHNCRHSPHAPCEVGDDGRLAASRSVAHKAPLAQ